MTHQICIIGCGDMGNQHAGAWAKRQDCRIVAVCDLIAERRDALAAKVGAKAYEKYEDAIHHPGVEIVSVCVPVCMHPPVTIFAAGQKKHVLCEKPIALTLDQADAMIRAARENGVHLSTSFQYRGFPRNQKLRELVCTGAFGGPLHARYIDIREVRPKLAMHRTSMNGGPVIDMASHHFDLMRFFTGEEPVQVYAQGHIFGQGKPRLSSISDFAIDAASIEVAYSGGSRLNTYVNWGMPEGFAEITQELFLGPTLSARALGGNLELQQGPSKTSWEAGPTPAGPTVRIEGLLAAVEQNQPLEVTGENGRISLQCSLAALESIRTGQAVRL